MSEHHRLFIASTISDTYAVPMLNLLQSLQQQWKSASLPNTLRWIPPEHWHLTWAFLGDTPADKIPALQENLNQILTDQSVITTAWEQLSWWPSSSRPQILVGQLTPTPELITTAQAIQEAMNRLLPTTSEKNRKSKSFKPHITLARAKTSRNRNRRSSVPIPEQQSFKYKAPLLPAPPAEFPDWQIEGITLFRSELHSAGAVHTALYTVPFNPEPVALSALGEF